MDENAWSLPGYRIGEVLGRGGFATVYEAEQESLNRKVAVKVLDLSLATEAERRRFDRERQALTRLGEHPHVVDLYDAGVSNGHPFLVMRLYRRGTLAHRLATSGRLPVPETVDVVTKLASALDLAHRMGLLHRDVKPGNVLLTEDGEPVLADFGIASAADPDGNAIRTSTSTSYFTLVYTAPEMIERGVYTASSDVYALASTTYTLLAGHPAFDPRDPRVVTRILDEPVPPVERDDVSPSVRAVVLAGMSKDPSARPPSPGAFARALAEAALAPAALGTASPNRFPSAPVDPRGPMATRGPVVTRGPMVTRGPVDPVGTAAVARSSRREESASVPRSVPVMVAAAAVALTFVAGCLWLVRGRGGDSSPVQVPVAVGVPSTTGAAPSLAPTAAGPLTGTPDPTPKTSSSLPRAPRTATLTVPAGYDRAVNSSTSAAPGNVVDPSTSSSFSSSSSSSGPTSRSTSSSSSSTSSSTSRSTSSSRSVDSMPDVNYPSCERATISVAAGEKGRTTLVQRTCIERSGKNSYRATLNLHEQKVTSDDHVSADFTLELRRCEDDRPVEVISNSGGSSEKLSVSTSSISGVRVYAVSSVPSARLTVLGANGTRSEYTGAGTTSIAEGTCG